MEVMVEDFTTFMELRSCHTHSKETRQGGYLLTPTIYSLVGKHDLCFSLLETLEAYYQSNQSCCLEANVKFIGRVIESKHIFLNY